MCWREQKSPTWKQRKELFKLAKFPFPSTQPRRQLKVHANSVTCFRKFVIIRAVPPLPFVSSCASTTQLAWCSQPKPSPSSQLWSKDRVGGPRWPFAGAEYLCRASGYWRALALWLQRGRVRPEQTAALGAGWGCGALVFCTGTPNPAHFCPTTSEPIRLFSFYSSQMFFNSAEKKFLPPTRCRFFPNITAARDPRADWIH